MTIPKTKGDQVLRRGHFRREMEALNLILGQQTAESLMQYHMRFVEPRLRRIEWVLFPFRLWDIGKYMIKRWVREWKAKKARKLAPPVPPVPEAAKTA